MKDEKNDGITLIALVITIIIMLILAGVTLGTALGENGLFQRAKQAREAYKKAEEQESNGIEQLVDEMGKVNGEGGGETSPGTSESPEPTDSTEPETPPSIEPSTKPSEGSAGELEGQITGDNSVIGEKVEGLTTSEDLTETYKWQIFDVENGHVYLIASDYIKSTDCPLGKAGNVVVDHGNGYKNSMDHVVNGYNGSAEITDITMQNLNSEWFKLVKDNASTDANALAVAYMLDKDQWTKKFTGQTSGNKQIDYVIGGPTIEQLFKSYNKKHSDKTLYYQAVNDMTHNTTGYKISNDNKNWKYFIDSLLDTSDSAFVISNNSKANAMWVASPSAYNFTNIMSVQYDGGVRSNGWSGNEIGFRPIVCLKASATLTESEGVYTIQ